MDDQIKRIYKGWRKKNALLFLNFVKKKFQLKNKLLKKIYR